MTDSSDQKEILARLDRIQFLLEELIILKGVELGLSTHGVRRILKVRRGRVSEISTLHKNRLKS